jgi:hypothetical protein
MNRSRKLGRGLRWIFLVLLGCELILLYTSLIPPQVVALLVFITEGTALLLFLTIVIPAIMRISKRVKTGTRVTLAVQHELQSVLPKPLLTLVKFEIGLWAAFLRGIRNDRDIPAGSLSIDYGRELRTLCVVLACLAPVEIGAVELLCQHFGVSFGVRLAIWILSAYATFWIIGLALSIRIYPHYINSTEMVFRYCWYHVISIDTHCVAKVVQEKRECNKNKTIEYDDTLVALNDMRTTNISLYFKQPYKPSIDGELTHEAITRFSFSADNPQAACTSLYSILEATDPHNLPA